MILVAASATSSAAGDGTPKVRNQVDLVLQISGLGPEGGEIEVRPGHGACKFEPVVRKLQKAPSGSVVITNPVSILAESQGADRDCSFAIIIKEPGKAPRKYVRGLRLSPEVAGQALPKQKMTCYLSTPSLAAKSEGETRKR
jgi:hypothetical protein